MFAVAVQGDASVVKDLIDAGGRIDVQDPLFGNTLLLSALERSDVSPALIQILLEAGVDLGARNTAGWTALMSAAANQEDPMVVRMLIDAGADAEARSPLEGNTSLLIAAAFSKSPEVIRTLLDAGANIEARNNLGHTVLDVVDKTPNEALAKSDVIAEIRSAMKP